MTKTARPKAARQPTESTVEIFPASTATDRGTTTPSMSIWSCVNRSVTADLHIGDADEDGIFVTAQVHRIFGDRMTFELHSNLQAAVESQGFGKFEIPIELAPRLGDYFAEIVRLATREGLLKTPGMSEVTDENTFVLPPVTT